MSLIEEALRKQREETEQTQADAPKAAETPPPEQPPEEESPAPEEAPAARRPWRLLAIIGGVSVIIIVGLVWLLFFGLKIWSGKSKAATETRVTNTVGRVAASAATGTVKRAVAPAAPVPATNAVVATAATNAVPAAAATPPPPPPSAPATTPAVAKAVTPAPTATAPATGNTAGGTPRAETPAPVEEPTAAPWPKLTVSGFISKGRGARGVAIINGQVMGSGDVVEGVRIIAVEKQGVVMGFGGQTQTVVVGGTTE